MPNVKHIYHMKAWAAALLGLCGALMILRRMLNNLPQPNRRPVPPLSARQRFGRAFYARAFALVGDRSAKRWTD